MDDASGLFYWNRPFEMSVMPVFYEKVIKVKADVAAVRD